MKTIELYEQYTVPAKAWNIHEIVKKASLLDERMSLLHDQAQRNQDHAGTDRLLNEWMEAAAQGDATMFEKRLNWDNITPEMAEALLSDSSDQVDHELPAWASALNAVVELAAEIKETSIKGLERWAGASEPNEPIAFEHLLFAFVKYAKRAVFDENPAAAHLLDQAKKDLTRWLLRRLSVIAGATFMLEFSTSLALTPAFMGEPDRYSLFVAQYFENGFVDTMNSHPFLARELSQVTLLWISSTRTFLERLSQDKSLIESRLGDGVTAGNVSSMYSHLSDPHAGGEIVLKLIFESGLTCFYKPKDIRSDAIYDAMLEWINTAGNLPELKRFTTICREGYGWSQAVQEMECRSTDELERYYYRAGMILCLLYILGGTDCNVENLIAAGEYPVLIDTETLFQPIAKIFDEIPWKAIINTDEEMFQNSVFRVGMLPRWKPGPDGTKHDLSSFGWDKSERGSGLRRVWENINSDNMRYEWKDVEVLSSRPSMAGRPGSPASYCSFIEQGFAGLYGFFIDHKDELRAFVFEQPDIATVPLRFLVRNTFIYDALLQNLYTAKVQASGIHASFILEKLVRPFLKASQRPHAWPLLQAERRSLALLDVPRFSCTPGSDSLLLPDGTSLPGYLKEPSILALRKRIDGLSVNDLELQRRYIRASFSDPYSASAPAGVEIELINENQEPLPDQQLIEEALKIAHQLHKNVIEAPDGTVTWVTYTYNADSQFSQLSPMGIRLYDGITGVALFLSAISAVSGERTFRDLVNKIFKMASVQSSQLLWQHWLNDALGAGLGLPSVIYALIRTSALLESPDLLQLALDLSKLITPEHIKADKKYDVLGGSAGCALVLTKLFKCTADSRVAELALACGDHLLKNRQEVLPDLHTWTTIQEKPLAGFSHGAAGIALSLARLSEVFEEHRFRDAAEEAIKYENTLFDEAYHNWPNLLSRGREGKPGFWNAWCHGAPGIGLARLAMVNGTGEHEYMRDINESIIAVSEQPLNPVDHLCCGTLGRIDTLVEAGLKSGRSDMLDRARSITAQVVTRARARKAYLIGHQDAFYIPSFFQGMSGIGYQLLRMSDPTKFESVLNFQ